MLYSGMLIKQMQFRHLAGDIAVLERNTLEISERQMLPIAGYRSLEVFVDRVLICHVWY